jgi:hypothetical protein
MGRDLFFYIYTGNEEGFTSFDVKRGSWDEPPIHDKIKIHNSTVGEKVFQRILYPNYWSRNNHKFLGQDDWKKYTRKEIQDYVEKLLGLEYSNPNNSNDDNQEAIEVYSGLLQNYQFFGILTIYC